MVLIFNRRCWNVRNCFLIYLNILICYLILVFWSTYYSQRMNLIHFIFINFFRFLIFLNNLFWISKLTSLFFLSTLNSLLIFICIIIWVWRLFEINLRGKSWVLWIQIWKCIYWRFQINTRIGFCYWHKIECSRCMNSFILN